VEVVPAPMAGLVGRHGDDFGQVGKQAGPVEVLGRADTAAGRRRDGKPPERPPAAGPAPQPDAAAVRRVPERGDGSCGGATAAGPRTVRAAGNKPTQSCWQPETVGGWLCGCRQSGRG